MKKRKNIGEGNVKEEIGKDYGRKREGTDEESKKVKKERRKDYCQNRRRWRILVEKKERKKERKNEE